MKGKQMKEIEKKLLEQLQIDSKIYKDNALCVLPRMTSCEKFYLGHQWDPNDKSEDKPVFNITKRICDYVISTLCGKEFDVTYTLDGAPFGTEETSGLREAVDQLSRHVSFIYDKEKLERLVYDLVRDAVIFGNGVLYTYWDANDQSSFSPCGRMKTVSVDPRNVFPGNLSITSVEDQPYIIMRGIESISSLLSQIGEERRDAREELKENATDSYATYTAVFKKVGGRVMFSKEACGVLISYGDTGLTRYPFTVFTPIPRRKSFFGRSYVDGIIPNQRYINKAYSMLMKHMKETAFSKVVYDRSRIPEWTGEPGVAIAAHGGGNLSDCVSVVGCGKLEDGYTELIQSIAESTKELYGATETALGNAEPTNTSAILALKEASENQLRGSIILLTSALEEQALVWADMICAFYCSSQKVYTENGGEKNFIKALEQGTLKGRISVSDKSKFGSSVSLSVLNKLLECGAISASEYIKRLPGGIIPDKDGLAAHAKELEDSKGRSA